MTTEMVPLKIDGIFLYQITDPVRSITRVQDLAYTMTLLAQTELRNLMSSHSMTGILQAKQKLSDALLVFFQ